MVGEEHPDVEVLHAVLTVEVMKGRSLTESYAEESLGQAEVVRVSNNESGEVGTSDLGQQGEIISLELIV